ALFETSDREILIRRVISRTGRNRITVDGNLATLSMLESLGSGLVELHGQHQHQSLLLPETQTDHLDGFGGLTSLRKEMAAGCAALKEAASRLESLRVLERDRAQREEFLRFQEREIAESEPEPGEDEALQQERRRLAHGEKLSSLARTAYQTLYEDEDSVLARLQRCEGWLREISALDGSLEETSRWIASGVVPLQEAAAVLRDYAGKLEFDPERLGEIEDRLHRLERLKKKYGPSLQEVLDHREKVREDLRRMASVSEEIASLERETGELEKGAVSLAERLTEGRRGAAKTLQGRVEKELTHLGIPHARFVIAIDRGTPLPGPSGWDRVTFLISANPGEEPKPLGRVASGGELSRVMLALKVVLASVDRIPTLVFDEVDTGIGGKVAEEVGIRLKRLSKTHQVACITHLPQIASLADHHYTVEKITEDGRTTVRVRRLNDGERVEEIARMLGGKTITETTRRHAAEMLQRGKD
ncbi:MAG: DNA repair protein RecN, partial [Nitrospirae bacterium]|nr:DNA repair protein RecN [Nitrospirota bacterium]